MVTASVTVTNTDTGVTATSSQQGAITGEVPGAFAFPDWINAPLVLPGVSPEFIVFPASGGNFSNVTSNKIYSYNTTTGVITQRQTIATAMYGSPIGCVMSDGRIFWGGGGDSTACRSFYIFDPTTYTNTAVAAPPAGYYWNNPAIIGTSIWGGGMRDFCVEMGDGRILLPSAKSTVNGNGFTYDNKAHIYDPVLNTWSLAPNFPLNTSQGKCFYSSETGYTYVLMGDSATNSYNGFIYKWKTGDPAWTLFATLPINMAYQSTANVNGYIFVAGGNNGNYTNAAYLVKFSTGAITTLPVLTAFGTNTAYINMTSTVVGNKVVLTGGNGNLTGVTANVHVYDTDLLTTTRLSLSSTRRAHAAILGADGNIHILQGNQQSSPIAAATKTPIKLFLG